MSLKNNPLKNIPLSLTLISSLKTLNLSNCGITQIPESFENLANLKELDLSNNNITHLPKFLRRMKNLKINLRGSPLDFSNPEMAIYSGLIKTFNNGPGLFTYKNLYLEPIIEKFADDKISWNFYNLRDCKYKPIPELHLSFKEVERILNTHIRPLLEFDIFSN